MCTRPTSLVDEDRGEDFSAEASKAPGKRGQVATLTQKYGFTFLRGPERKMGMSRIVTRRDMGPIWKWTPGSLRVWLGLLFRLPMLRRQHPQPLPRHRGHRGSSVLTPPASSLRGGPFQVRKHDREGKPTWKVPMRHTAGEGQQGSQTRGLRRDRVTR